jgi:L-asparaginase/Glu-tRNA(Gln) amidotransferase subunit D
MLNYKKYDAFVVLCGFDVICYISTLISFMFENLSKLIIFTGGYFPASFMRNDVVNNLI